MSWPGWLTYSGRFTDISGHPSAAGRVQDRESSPAKDRRSTAVPRNQPGAGPQDLLVGQLQTCDHRRRQHHFEGPGARSRGRF